MAAVLAMAAKAAQKEMMAVETRMMAQAPSERRAQAWEPVQDGVASHQRRCFA
jgi:hypothetical protein